MPGHRRRLVLDGHELINHAGSPACVTASQARHPGRPAWNLLNAQMMSRSMAIMGIDHTG
ncbi:hypothetical protein [Kitasatospora camelliae]|uniref:Uncharacterized protein n=1 Tax=Kitasatospora camelliae TaxID=3156397 RepID=A0AAU8K4R3_9ACTN